MPYAHGVSIAICTWNRAELLEVTLESLCTLAVPPGVAWEVMVVDNGSTDATPAVAARFADRLPVRYVWAPEPGLGHVRNAAVAAARYDALAFIDDDVRVTQGWLAALWAALEAHPEAVFFGGTITAEFMAPPPGWLRRVFPQVQNYYSVQDRGRDSSGPIIDGDFPFGANLCVRTSAAREIGFDVNVVYRESVSLAAGDESALLSTLLKRGQSGWWAAEAAIAHRIQPARLTAHWLFRRLTGAGVEMARGLPRVHVRQFLNAPWWVWREFLRAGVRTLTRLFYLDPSRWGGDAARVIVIGSALVSRGRHLTD